MRRVILESPYAGEVEANLAYARACLRDCLKRGEAPIASHLLFTQPGVLDDAVHAERMLGIEAGLAWVRFAAAGVFYLDRGWSGGMSHARDRYELMGIPVEERTLAGYDPLAFTSEKVMTADEVRANLGFVDRSDGGPGRTSIKKSHRAEGRNFVD